MIFFDMFLLWFHLSLPISCNVTLSFLKTSMAPPRKKSKGMIASHEHAAPTGIIIEEEKFSTPLTWCLYYEQCESPQVIDGRSIKKSSYVLQQFVRFASYSLIFLEHLSSSLRRCRPSFICKHECHQRHWTHDPILCPWNSHRVSVLPFCIKP